MKRWTPALEACANRQRVDSYREDKEAGIVGGDSDWAAVAAGANPSLLKWSLKKRGDILERVSK